MSTRVYKGNINVESFKFSEIIAGEVAEKEFDEFKLNSLNNISQEDPLLANNRIRKEREAESGSSFSIDDRVRHYRGIRDQEQQDYEKRVSDEVNSQLELTRQKAYEEGLLKGKELGHKQAYDESSVIIQEKLEAFSKELEDGLSFMNDVFEKNKKDAYSMVKNLSKWVVLKEVDEKDYLERLLEKLILEIKTKNSLLVRVNESSFEFMPEIIEIIQNRVGKLTNIRVEVELDMEGPGIILESENGIIDGTLNAQFKSIDKLFEHIGVGSSDES